jgi:hypothetical protein
VIDWRGAVDGTGWQQHAFNVIGARWLAAGTHVVELRAVPIAGCFDVEAGANLSVLKTHATTVTDNALPGDWGTFDYTTTPSYHFDPDPGSTIPVPHAPAVSVPANGNQDVVLLGSGRSFDVGQCNDLAVHSGDAMWGFFSSRSGSSHDLGTRYSTWAINDLMDRVPTGCHCESQAPMYAQAFIPAAAFCGQFTTLSLDASEEPWDPAANGENGVQYSMGAGTRMVSLQGGMQVRGSAPQSWYDDYTKDIAAPMPAATDNPIASAMVYIPDGHNGVVFFSSRTRLYQYQTTSGGTFSLWIELDRGQPYARIGPKTVNTFIAGSASARTSSASYLADDASPLITGGWHRVELFARMDPDNGIGTMVYYRDLPLMWFD